MKYIWEQTDVDHEASSNFLGVLVKSPFSQATYMLGYRLETRDQFPVIVLTNISTGQQKESLNPDVMIDYLNKQEFSPIVQHGKLSV